MDQRREQALLAEADDARRRGDLRAAMGALGDVVNANPAHAEARHLLARIMAVIDDPGAAVEEMRRAVAAHPDRARWQYDLGDVCARAGLLEEAVEAFRRAEAMDPGEATYPGRIAAISRRLRDNAGAVEAAERALRLDPDQGFALQVMSQEALRAGRVDEAEAYARRIIDSADAPADEVPGWHALGRVLERRERWGEAFDAHMSANRIKLQNAAARDALRSDVVRQFPIFLGHDGPARYRAWGARRYDDSIPAPVILTGFPRSGTTMTEQILAAHPALATGEERDLCLPVLREVGEMVGGIGLRPFLGQLDELSDEQVGRLRAVYRQGLELAVVEELRGRVLVDKHPLRVIDLGLVNRIFPEARVIVMVRDPRDVCLSALFQDFAINPGMVRFLSPELCVEWYAKVMGFWLRLREMLTLDVLVVRYEDLVTDFETWAPRLIEFTGVAWDDRVREFHTGAGRRVVRSASFEAVTEPLNRRAIGRWRRYRDRMAPMLDRLEPFVSAFGYDASDAPPALGDAGPDAT